MSRDTKPMRRAFYGYERNFANRWCPVVYYDFVPPPSCNGHSYEQSDFIAVPNNCIDNGEPLFGKLKQLHPVPEE